MKYVVFSLLFFSNVAFASEDLKKELLTCVKETQQRALKVSKGMADYDEIIKTIKDNKTEILKPYMQDLKSVKSYCGGIFPTNHQVLESIYKYNDSFELYNGKIIEEDDSYNLYEITEDYYIFQKQDVTPVGIFLALKKKKAPNNYQYNYDDSLDNAYPAFLENNKTGKSHDITRRLYKITGLTKVFNRSTKKVVSMALVIEFVKLQ